MDSEGSVKKMLVAFMLGAFLGLLLDQWFITGKLIANSQREILQLEQEVQRRVEFWDLFREKVRQTKNFTVEYEGINVPPGAIVLRTEYGDETDMVFFHLDGKVTELSVR